MKQTLFGGVSLTMDEMLDRCTAGAKKHPETLESVIAELRQLESDPLVRLADEEDELMDSLKVIRDILRKKQARGRELEANGVTLELIRRYRKDYAETDWGA